MCGGGLTSEKDPAPAPAPAPEVLPNVPAPSPVTLPAEFAPFYAAALDAGKNVDQAAADKGLPVHFTSVFAGVTTR